MKSASHLKLALTSLLVLSACGERSKAEAPRAATERAALTEEVVRSLLPVAAAANPEAWQVVVALGAMVTPADLAAAPDLPLLALVVATRQWPPDARHDVRIEPTTTPLDFDLALRGPSGAFKSTASAPRASLLRPEYIERVSVEQAGDEAHGDVWFRAPRAFAGRVRYKAVRSGGAWWIVAFEFPYTRARIERPKASDAWRLVRFPTVQPSANLPRVSEAAPVPAAAKALVVTMSTRSGIVVNGQAVRSFDALRDAIRARAGELQREPDGSSEAEVVVLADEEMPWHAVLWAMQSAADPRTKAYRIHFGVRHRASGEVGVLSTRLPKDRGIIARPIIVEPRPAITLRMFGRDSGRPTSPEAVYQELVRRHAAGDANRKVEIAAPMPNGARIRYGYVMGLVDAVHRAGYADIVFEGTAMPRSVSSKPGIVGAPDDLDAAIKRLLDQPVGTPIVKIDGKDLVGSDTPPGPIPDGSGPIASGAPPEPPPFEDVVASPADASPSSLRPSPSESESSGKRAPIVFAAPTEAPPEEELPPTPEETEEIHLSDAVAKGPTVLESDLPTEESLGGTDGLEDAPFEGPANNGLIGTGGGAGGAFKGRGGRAATKAADDAVTHALRWLAAHQSTDGGWEAEGFGSWCEGRAATGTKPDGQGKATYDVGVTGLALCAFLGAGYTHRGDHPFAKVVSRGLGYLRRVQDADGCFGSRTSGHYVYNHATASLAMVEAFGLTESTSYKHAAQKALDFIALCRNPYFAWRYGVKPGDNDTAVSGWMLMALKSARLVNEAAATRGRPAPLTIDEEAFDGMKAWLDKMTDPEFGRVGYQQRGTGPARPTDLVDRFPADKSESMTAVGMLARIFMGEDPRKSDLIRKGADLCVKLPPTWNTTDGSIDMYYWYEATLAMFHVGGDHWKKWSDAMAAAMIPNQRMDGEPCGFRGSFDPVDPWGADGGRVYSTAIMALSLEIYFRYDKAFGAGK